MDWTDKVADAIERAFVSAGQCIKITGGKPHKRGWAICYEGDTASVMKMQRAIENAIRPHSLVGIADGVIVVQGLDLA